MGCTSCLTAIRSLPVAGVRALLGAQACSVDADCVAANPCDGNHPICGQCMYCGTSPSGEQVGGAGGGGGIAGVCCGRVTPVTSGSERAAPPVVANVALADWRQPSAPQVCVPRCGVMPCDPSNGACY